jgi:hypothetical protein
MFGAVIRLRAGWDIMIRLPAVEKIFLTQKRPDRLDQASYAMSKGAFSPGIKAAWAWSLPPTIIYCQD